MVADFVSHPDLIVAAYSSNTWKKINSAMNMFELFASERNIVLSWPFIPATVINFIDWAVFSRKLAPSSIKSYLSHMKLVHSLRGLDSSAFQNFLCKTQIKGVCHEISKILQQVTLFAACL